MVTTFEFPTSDKRCDTGLNGSPVEMNRTSPALGDAASVLGAGQPQVIAEHPQERSLAGDILQLMVFAIDIDFCHGTQISNNS